MTDLTLCKKYMLIEENITDLIPKSYEKQKFKTPKINQTPQKIQTSMHNDIKATLRNKTDQLFWTFFIILKGEHEYDMNNLFQFEKNFKIQCIEELRKIKPELKLQKLRLNEVEDELLNCKCITIKSVIALCLLYKKNLVYIWDRKYFEIITNGEELINIIINNKDSQISYDTTGKKVDYYRENYLHILNITKPLKAITSYTRDELLEIAKKLDIQDLNNKSNNKTKKIIYERILERI